MTFRKFADELEDLGLEIISRSGTTSKEVQKRITADLEREAECMMRSLPRVLIDDHFELVDSSVQRFKEEYLNRWMTLHHELIVRKQHFNWNWP